MYAWWMTCCVAVILGKTFFFLAQMPIASAKLPIRRMVFLCECLIFWPILLQCHSCPLVPHRIFLVCSWAASRNIACGLWQRILLVPLQRGCVCVCVSLALHQRREALQHELWPTHLTHLERRHEQLWFARRMLQPSARSCIAHPFDATSAS